MAKKYIKHFKPYFANIKTKEFNKPFFGPYSIENTIYVKGETEKSLLISEFDGVKFNKKYFWLEKSHILSLIRDYDGAEAYKGFYFKNFNK